ncbi:MAG: hypothetical protein L0Y78_09660 [candidate division NC10 bacterium]|nr:hypothetical protein [candidate division NC10 bacterium]
MLDALAFQYPWIMAAVGMLGFALGVNRTIKHRKGESTLLQVLSFFGGIVVLALPIVILLRIKQEGVYTGYSLALMIILSLSLTARPLKRIPLAYIAVIAVGVGLFWMALKFKETQLGKEIAMETFAIIILLILAFVFAMSFFVEKSIGALLAILGWGPVITLLSAGAVIHGVLIGAGLTNKSGIFQLLGIAA